MDRKWKSGAAAGAPALDNASDGYATAGNPAGGVPATKPGPHWYHMVTEELLAIIAYVGVALDKTNLTQVRDALLTLFDPQGIEPGGRLTLTTGVPVTTAGVAGAATVYYTPHRHNRVRLYDGTRWKWYTFAEMSQALNDATKSPAAVAANKNYDYFVWDDAGTLRCTRGPKWDDGAVAGSNVLRGTGAASTELELFDGRLVNKIAIANGPAARLGVYVGTIGTDGSVQTNDTAEKRCVFNYYNERKRTLARLETADSWTYTTAAFRQMNNNAANQVEVVVGLQRDPVSLTMSGRAQNASATPCGVLVGIGVDSTSVNSSHMNGAMQTTGTVNSVVNCQSSYNGFPGLGRHSLNALEYSDANGTTTWTGDSGVPTLAQSGLLGECFA